MKNATDHAKKLGPLLKKIARQYPPSSDEPTPRDPIGQLIYGFLEWEATSRAAELAMERLAEIAVDHNDLRVCHVAEIIEALGPRYPRVEERAARLRDVLNGVFMLEHDTSLNALASQSKRDIRQYLDALPGIAPYVAARTFLVAFGGHGVPVDERLVSLLEQAGVIEPNVTVAQVTSFLERHIKASDAVQTHHVLRAWADQAPAVKPKPAPKSKVKSTETAKTSPPAKKTIAKKAPAKKTTKKTAAKTTKKTTPKTTKKITKKPAKKSARKAKK